MQNDKALIVVEKLDPIEIFKAGGIDSILEQIESKVSDLVFDAEDEKSRQECVSTAYAVTRSKTLLDKMGKERGSKLKKELDEINGERKKARDFLDPLAAKVREPVTEWEAEQERIAQEEAEKEKAKIQARIDELQKYGVVKPFVEVATLSEDEYGTILIQAISDHEAEQSRLAKEAAEREAEEKRLAEERAELEKLRKEQEERDRAEREKQEAAENKLAEERAAIEAEKKALEDAKRAEQERKEREERERIEAEEAKKRAEKEAAEKAEAEKKEKERKLALRPDKEKIKTWIKECEWAPEPPDIEDDHISILLAGALETINDILNDLDEQVEAL